MENVKSEYDPTGENTVSLKLVHKDLESFLDIQQNHKNSQLELTLKYPFDALGSLYVGDLREEQERDFWIEKYETAKDNFVSALTDAEQQLGEVQNFIKQEKEKAKQQGSKKNKRANFGEEHPSENKELDVPQYETFTIEKTNGLYGDTPRSPSQQNDHMNLPSATVVATSKEDLRNLSAWCDAREAELKAANNFLKHVNRSVHFSSDSSKISQKFNSQEAALAANSMCFMRDLISDSYTVKHRMELPSARYRQNYTASRHNSNVLLTLAAGFDKHPQLKRAMRYVLIGVTIGLLATGAILLGLGHHGVGPSPDYVGRLIKELCDQGAPAKVAESVAPTIIAVAGAITGSVIAWGIFAGTGQGKRANAVTNVAEAGKEFDKEQEKRVGKEGGFY